MRRFLASFAACLGLLWTQAASAAIGVPVNVGNTSCASCSSQNTTAATQPANTFVLIVQSVDGSTATAPTDGGGNTYTALTTVTNGSVSQTIFYTSVVTATGTIAIHSAGSATEQFALVYTISGLLCAPGDKNGAGTTGTGTSPSIATGTLAQASEIIIGATSYLSAAATYTESASFTTAANGNNSGVGGVIGGGIGYDIVAATTTVTYAPTISSSSVYVANVASFKGGACPAASANRGSLLGVGR